MGLFDRWHDEVGSYDDSKAYERQRIADVIKSCAETYDPVTDADVPAYLRTLAKRIQNGEL